MGTETMFCRNCGKELTGAPEFCMNCGVKPLSGTSFCSNCGAQTTAVTEMCPKCGAPSEKFGLLDDQAAELVERSRRTNALLCRLVDLGRQVEWACREGLEDNLDPNCAGVFKRAQESSWEIMKLAMTEIQSHAGKNKWG